LQHNPVIVSRVKEEIHAGISEAPISPEGSQDANSSGSLPQLHKKRTLRPASFRSQWRFWDFVIGRANGPTRAAATGTGSGFPELGYVNWVREEAQRADDGEAGTEGQ
jgi:hypothetical protein